MDSITAEQFERVYLQMGEYPVYRVIFCNLDSVTGSLWMPFLKEKYGFIDVVHQIRSSNPHWSDVDFILKSGNPVISTCWDERRTILAASYACQIFGYPNSFIRVYSLNSGQLNY